MLVRVLAMLCEWQDVTCGFWICAGYSFIVFLFYYIDDSGGIPPVRHHGRGGIGAGAGGEGGS